MTVSIHQPNFLPWFGYFHKLAHSDVFVFLDDVQLPRGKSFVSRVKVKTQNGEHWLTLPVSGKSEMLPIHEVALADARVLKKLLRTLEVTYKKSEYFQPVYGCIARVFDAGHTLLSDFNIALIASLSHQMGLKTRFMKSSEMDCNLDYGAEKIACILQTAQATKYISGKGGGSRRYIVEIDFDQAGMELHWQEFDHPVYDQMYGGEFIPNLSIIDMLFNLGFEKTVETLLLTKISK